MDLPPRYAQTLMAQPNGDEQRLYRDCWSEYLRRRRALPPEDPTDGDEGDARPDSDWRQATSTAGGRCVPAPAGLRPRMRSCHPWAASSSAPLLSASGSHPRSLAESLEKMAGTDAEAARVINLARGIQRSAKDEKLLGLLGQSRQEKVLVFANFRRTLQHLQRLLDEAGIAHVTFSGAESDRQKDEAVEAFRQLVPVMLCSESGGEGRNLQFANTLINYDLPWNPDEDRAARGSDPPYRPDPRGVHLQPLHRRLAGSPAVGPA